MNKEIINSKYGDIPILTNDSTSKKALIYFHGLDGSAKISKPLFDKLSKYKIVAVEGRGHMLSKVPASRMIHKHIYDYIQVIKFYKKLGYKVWILGESMGAAYCTEIAYKTKGLVEGVFAQSIPNQLVNIMVAPKFTQFKIQFMTFISFFTNINYKYKSSVNYEKLSSNRTLQRVARIADKGKVRNVRETLATWAITKRAWRRIKRQDPKTPLYYFQPLEDVIVNVDKAKKILSKNRKNINYFLIPNAKHILMYEKEFDFAITRIKKIMG